METVTDEHSLALALHYQQYGPDLENFDEATPLTDKAPHVLAAASLK